MSEIKSYRDLQVWQKSRKLNALTYRLVKQLPGEDQHRIGDQIVRAAASVPANIAEGHERGSRRDYARFVSIACGSLAELETHILCAIDVELLSAEQTAPVLRLSNEISRMLHSLRAKLRVTAMSSLEPVQLPTGLGPNP